MPVRVKYSSINGLNMNIAEFSQAEIDASEDRAALLRSKGVPMTKKGNNWVLDDNYLMQIELVKKLGTWPEPRYRYTWWEKDA